MTRPEAVARVEEIAKRLESVAHSLYKRPVIDEHMKAGHSSYLITEASLLRDAVEGLK